MRAFRSLLAAAVLVLPLADGRSEGAADLLEYEIEFSYAGRTKRLTADDLTLPPELGTIRDRLSQAIDSARGR